MIDNLITVPVLAVGAFLTVSYFANPSTVIIKEMSVTEIMEYDGYHGEVVTEGLSNKIDAIIQAAGTNRGSFLSRETTRAKSVEGLTDSFGLRKPIRDLQVALGWLPYTFGGEFTQQEGDALRLEIAGASPTFEDFELEVESEDGNIDEMLQEAAIKLLQAIDPYLLAVYQFRQETAHHKESGTPDYTKTKVAIEHALVHEDRSHMPWVYALWGAVLYAEGDYEAAIVRYRQSLKLDPTFPRPMMRWGQALAAMDRYDEAIGRYKATLTIDPQYPEALVLWGDSLIAKGEIEQAREVYTRAVKMAPDFPRILHSYGLFEWKYGDKIAAAHYLRQAVELQGKHALDTGQGEKFKASLRAVQADIDPAIAGLVAGGPAKE